MQTTIHETGVGPLTLDGALLYEVQVRLGHGDERTETVVVAADNEWSARTRAVAVTSLDPHGRLVEFAVREKGTNP